VEITPKGGEEVDGLGWVDKKVRNFSLGGTIRKKGKSNVIDDRLLKFVSREINDRKEVQDKAKGMSRPIRTEPRKDKL